MLVRGLDSILLHSLMALYEHDELITPRCQTTAVGMTQGPQAELNQGGTSPPARVLSLTEISDHFVCKPSR